MSGKVTRGDLFPTLCLCQIKCGSLQIWVSGSFMCCSYSEQLIQPCLSSPQHAAHPCLDGASHTRQCKGKKSQVKNSTCQYKISVVLASVCKPKVLCTRPSDNFKSEVCNQRQGI